MRPIRAHPLIAVGVGLLAAAAAAVAVAAPSAKVPPQDTFHGTINTAASTFARVHGHVTIRISPGHSATGTRRVTVKLSGRPCHHSRGCMQLNGTVTGTLTRTSSIPDVGASFSLKASGRVKPIGHVSATGQVHGTGFIMRGHETMTLHLSASHGEVEVEAQSPALPGFTAP
jgi:hypothetical protein